MCAPSARSGPERTAEQRGGVVPPTTCGWLLGGIAGADSAHQCREYGELFSSGLAPNDAQGRTLLRLGHSGMFPCFFGGSVSRLLRSMRSDLIT
jgi:hypothetical protein